MKENKTEIGSEEWMKEQLENDRQRAVLILAEMRPYWDSFSLIVTGWLAGAIKFPFRA